MIRQHPSPNHDSRGGRAVDMVVLHYTGMKSAAESLARLCDPDAKVSAHYLIDEAGDTFQLVSEERRAWHAGVAFWANETDINAISIGIELQNPGHEFGYRAFPDVQIERLVELMGSIRQRHKITPDRIVGHSDVAPVRKEDPGELFPWDRLSRAGHAIWPEREAAAHPVDDAADAMSRIGYAVSGSADNPGTRASLIAFQRRFMPWNLSGEADAATLHRIGQVLCLTVDS